MMKTEFVNNVLSLLSSYELHNEQNFLSQVAFTCSKLTKESVEQGVKYANGVALVSLLLTLNIFHTLLYCFYC